MYSTKAVQLALRAQAETLPALPASRAWANRAFRRTPGQPFVEEDFQRATGQLRGGARGGLVVSTGIYVLKWFGLADRGIAMLDDVDALLALYTPGSTLTATDGTVVHVSGDAAPAASALRPIDGWTLSVVTIPWFVFSNNPS